MLARFIDCSIIHSHQCIHRNILDSTGGKGGDQLIRQSNPGIDWVVEDECFRNVGWFVERRRDKSEKRFDSRTVELRYDYVNVVLLGTLKPNLTDRYF